MAKTNESAKSADTKSKGKSSASTKTTKGASASKGRPTPKNKGGVDYEAIHAKNRAARMQWIAIFGGLALIVIVAIVLFSIFGDGYSGSGVDFRLTGQG